ncbi:MAG: hypothetical protein IPF99_32560 [Deltaproteobacteria bacterium]|nr:hypothetical protein [Deltaproteobacteria bacterium]
MHRSSNVPWLLGLMGGFAMACSDGAATVASDAGVTADTPVVVDAGPAGLPVLGRGTHREDAVQVRVIATAEHTLATPRDVAFNPESPREMWVANFGDSSMTIFRNAGAADQDFDNRAGPQHTHFMSHVSCLAFGAPGMLATAHEEDDFTQGPPPRGSPVDFMGPTLFLSGYDEFDGGHASHIDMLHNSPNAQGIAWKTPTSTGWSTATTTRSPATTSARPMSPAGSTTPAPSCSASPKGRSATSRACRGTSSSTASRAACTSPTRATTASAPSTPPRAA